MTAGVLAGAITDSDQALQRVAERLTGNPAFAGSRPIILKQHDPRPAVVLVRTAGSGSSASTHDDDPAKENPIAIDDLAVELRSDPFGLSSMYYRRGPGVVYFANSLAALIAIAGEAVHLDTIALVQQATFGWPLAARTFISDVRRLGRHCATVRVCLDAAHSLHVRERARPYPVDPPVGYGLTSHTLVDQLAGDARDGDVLFLSGGIDSALMAGAYAQTGRPVRTITFGAADSDDMRLAGSVAARLGIEHQVIECSPRDALDGLVEAVYDTEQPTASPVHASVVRAVAPMADRIVGGEGCDLIFGGDWQLRYPTEWLKTAIETYRAAGHRDTVSDGVLTWLLTADDDGKSRIRQVLVEHLLVRSMSPSLAIGRAADVGIRFPYLSETLLAAVNSAPEVYLEPAGWKPWIRRVAAPALLTADLASQLLGQPKRPPMNATHFLLRRIKETALRVAPPNWFNRDHPGAAVTSTALPVDVYRCVVLDLFTYLFVLTTPQHPSGMRMTDIYADPRATAALRECYAETMMNRRVRDESIEMFAMDLMGARPGPYEC